MPEENKKHDSEGYKKSPDCLLKSKHEPNLIKNVIGVVSGKGGVGKSLITSMTAVMLRRKGYQVGVMDADITGPSIPKIFGADDLKPDNMEMGLFPIRTQSDIKLMSINLLLNRKDDPVIWRGPLIAKTVKHFWTDVVWGNLDYLLIDMPPGTGDVPLTIFQSIPLNGIIIVTSPQDLVSLIVRKAYRMAKVMNIPVLGFVENMSYVVCPKCGDHIDIFGKSKATRVAREMGIPLLDKVPVDPELAALCDKGEIEMMRENCLCDVGELLGNLSAGEKDHE